MKLIFEVLCLNINIPNKLPIAPPINEILNKSFSDMRLLFFIANNLSIPKSINERIFTIKR